MILKSYLVEKNISLVEKYYITLIYGENVGMKDDLKDQIKKYFKNFERVLFIQEEILKKKEILTEQIENTSLFSKNKIIFINEVTDKIKDIITEISINPNPDIKIFLFAQSLDKKTQIRKDFEKKSEVGVIACYQDNERTLADYIRNKMHGYTGVTQQMINFILSNSGLDRKTITHEIDKIKALFSDKKVIMDKLPELLNNNNNLDFNNVRDSCLSGDKDNLNKDLGNVVFQSENAYFYLSVLSNRIEKLFSLFNELSKEGDLEKAVDKLKPPIFWKDKPIFHKQIKKWNIKKLEEAKKMLFETEIQIKVNANLNNNLIIKNLILNLYQKATTTS